MTENSLKYIVSVLKGEEPETEVEWYETLGFLYCHRIAGLFYNRAKRAGVTLPAKIEKQLSSVYEAQKRRVQFMREQVWELSGALLSVGAEHVLLKGSVLANLSKESRIYEDGERISNDVDILVKPSGITAVSDCLKNLGYVQGRYETNEEKIIPFSRTELLKRRMNRGETAPFLKLTGNPEQPFTEVDINFSLGNTPGEKEELLSEMIATRKKYEGLVTMSVADEEMFFLHLVMHQYKESCLYFMVEKGKELDLYKLADMYYLWKSELFDKVRLKDIAARYGVKKEMGTVLGQVGRIFEDEEILTEAEEYGSKQPEIVDYDNKKKYFWTADERTRLCGFKTRKFLREIKDV